MTYLQKVALSLDLESTDITEVLRELKSHLDSVTDDLIESGMDPEQARAEAENRMGAPTEVALQFNNSHNSASWSSAVFSALPFLVWSILSLVPTSHRIKFLTSIIAGLIALVFCIRELRCTRRPAWLTPCFAAALSSTGLGLLIPVLALSAAYKIHKLLKLTTTLFITMCIFLLSLLAFGSKNETIFIALLLPISVISAAMLVIFARSISEIPKYSNAMQASLFLLCIYATVNVKDMESSYIIICGHILCGSLVFMFTRASKRIMKQKILSYAIAVHTIATSVGMEDYNVFSVITMIIKICIVIAIANWVIFIPIRSENDRNDTIPPFALE